MRDTKQTNFRDKIEHCKTWLLNCSYRYRYHYRYNYDYRFKPAADKFSSVLKKQALLATLLIFTTVGLSYYTSSSIDFDAVASVNTFNPIDTPASANTPEPIQIPSESALKHAKKHTDPTYVCPMHTDVISNDPKATCPICGMDLVAINNTSDEAGVISISPRVINMLGVHTRKAKRKTLYRYIDSVGNVKYDENKISHMHLRTDGWVEHLAVKTLGERVKKGDLLFKIYSPKLVNAQEELLQSLDLENNSLADASQDRLIALGMSKSQIRTLKKSRKIIPLINYYAPQNGVVSELNIREGMFVKPSESIISLVDMTTIWLIANIFESQADWVKIGDRATAELPFMPGKIWDGTIDYIYPILDPQTRSLEVRLRFNNPDELLKANMYADVKIFTEPKRKVLIIPRESLIRTGEGDRVIIALGDGKFKPVTVKVGIESNNKIEILHGLKEGDEVVVSSQFLIDSESNLQASLLRMSGG
ncbi:MAG: efflux RND transporter periplasmic adaptor subunit [Gammaproteobacteria bacterium]|nr:efflux RND transporter periplasmic adaptor subunit [Gammaproteobacteria bacterium]MCF6259013.1 efflux RND transporter periplasmic adaptor subunit [Gammaproteobacteria bacterium]